MDHYINEQGNTVFTSDYHRKKGSCCHSNCLHCPFGTTLKKIGIKFHEINEQNQREAEALYESLYNVSDALTSSLLAGAFGLNKNNFNPENFRILSLKDVICGMVEIRQSKVESLKLFEHFNNQGITESYLNSLL